METEFEDRLKNSPHLRQSLAELFRSVEQALAIVAAAAARQLDSTRLEADLTELQAQAASVSVDPTRDHLLKQVRLRLKNPNLS